MFIKVNHGYARARDVSLVRQFNGVTYISVRGFCEGTSSEVTTSLSVEEVLGAIRASAKDKEQNNASFYESRG